jgi:hypothetical protein
LFFLAAECKSKWTTLTNTYRRNLRDMNHIPSGSQGKQKRKTKFKKRKISSTDKVAEHLIDYLKMKKTQTLDEAHFKIQTAYTEDGADMLFLKSLLPDMQKLSAKHKRTFKANLISSLNNLIDLTEAENQLSQKSTVKR